MLELELEDLPRADRLGPAGESEVLRLHGAGMGIDALGARFRLNYAVIRRIVDRERARRDAAAEAAAREYEGLPADRSATSGEYEPPGEGP